VIAKLFQLPSSRRLMVKVPDASTRALGMTLAGLIGNVIV
jgi:hypothetical protein